MQIFILQVVAKIKLCIVNIFSLHYSPSTEVLQRRGAVILCRLNAGVTHTANGIFQLRKK